MSHNLVHTTGHDNLSGFADEFAHVNDDILFGEVWNDDVLDLKTRSIITVTSLLTSGIADVSMAHHLEFAKENGVTKEEIAAALTHAAFYAGWPKAWATFRLAKEIWKD